MIKKLKKQLQQSQRELKDQLQNKYFQYYIASILFVVISWFFLNYITLRIVSIGILIFTQFLYNIKVKTTDELFIRAINWAYFAFFLLSEIAYISTSVKEMEIALFMIVTIPIILCILILIPVFSDLWHSRNMLGLITSYAMLAFLLVIFFGYGFAILNSFSNNEIKWVSTNTIVYDTWDLIYFSAQIFYANSFGDIIPFGLSRVWSLMELAASAILHVILLGRIISRFK